MLCSQVFLQIQCCQELQRLHARDYAACQYRAVVARLVIRYCPASGRTAPVGASMFPSFVVQLQMTI